MIVISNLGDTLMTLGLKTIVTLLKMWLFLMIVLIISAIIGVLVFSSKYGISMILRYDFN